MANKRIKSSESWKAGGKGGPKGSDVGFCGSASLSANGCLPARRLIGFHVTAGRQL